MARRKITIHDLNRMKEKREPITMLTVYDYPMALLQEKAGVEVMLVGDSLGMTVLGYDSTLPVTMDIMIPHTQAVRKAAPSAYLVGDMPYMSYQISVEKAIANAGRYMAETGVDAIKLEGGKNVARTVEALVNATIPVMGHIGLMPQSAAMMGGFKAQGKTVETATKIIEDAIALEEAGISLLLVEGVPPEVGGIIAKKLSVPVIGIGGGPYCDGQLLIVHDMLGFFDQFTPKFVKKYANLNEQILEAFVEYKQDVKERRFPGPEHCYSMNPEEAERLAAKYGP